MYLGGGFELAKGKTKSSKVTKIVGAATVAAMSIAPAMAQSQLPLDSRVILTSATTMWSLQEIVMLLVLITKSSIMTPLWPEIEIRPLLALLKRSS